MQERDPRLCMQRNPLLNQVRVFGTPPTICKYEKSRRNVHLHCLCESLLKLPGCIAAGQSEAMAGGSIANVRSVAQVGNISQHPALECFAPCVTHACIFFFDLTGFGAGGGGGGHGCTGSLTAGQLSREAGRGASNLAHRGSAFHRGSLAAGVAFDPPVLANRVMAGT